MKHPKKIKRSYIDELFELDQTANVSLLQDPLYHATATFSQSYSHLFSPEKKTHCLMISGFDQYSFFQLACEISNQLPYLTKPSILVCKFLFPLDGSEGKMCSSGLNTQKATLYLTDTPNQIGKKIRASKSGARGDGSKEDHERLGGDIDEDTSCQLLLFFDDDEEGRKELFEKFASGKAYCGDTKNRLVQILTNILKLYQDSRKAITKESIKFFYSKEKPST